MLEVGEGVKKVSIDFKLGTNTPHVKISPQKHFFMKTSSKIFKAPKVKKIES